MKSAHLAVLPNETDPMLWRFEDSAALARHADEPPARHVKFHRSVDRSMSLQIWELWGQLACKTWQMERDGARHEGAALLDDAGQWQVSNAFPCICDVRDEKGRIVGADLELPMPGGSVARRSIRRP